MDNAPRFEQPASWQWASITPRTTNTGEAQTLRYGYMAPKGAKALCVIFPGLSEYCEKYFEVVHDLAARNMAVAVIDWRGQGLSWRHLPDHDKRHNDDFAYDVEDAKCFIEAMDTIPALKNLPKILLGHSMGGHIAARTLHDLQNTFRCAILSAPMFGINLPPHTEGPARFTADAACRMGFEDRYVIGAGPWSMAVFQNNLNILTTDPARRDLMRRHMDDNPKLRMGGLTFGWIRAAFAATHLTQDPKWLGCIHTPTLLVMAGQDMIVSNRAIAAARAAMPRAELLEIEGSLHEIMMEADTYRNQFWQGFDGFVAKYAGPV